MPKLDGWQVLSELRRRGNTPVIMLTALDQDVDKLTGLRVGADDYVAKPFNPAEIVARIQAVLRRSARSVAEEPTGLIRQGPFEIDLRSHEVTVRNGEQAHALNFTLTEFRLLVHMARAPRRCMRGWTCCTPACPRAMRRSAPSTAMSASCGASSRMSA
jgi:two-component system response regulator AdeR